MPDTNSYGRGSVQVFAPYQTIASAILPLTAAPDSVAFDAQGNLYVLTLSNGSEQFTFAYTIYEYAPGEPTPIKVISPPPVDENLDFLQVSPQGAVALLIFANRSATIYPPGTSSNSYQIATQPWFDGSAFSPSGEFAIGNRYNLNTYLPLSTIPNRTLTFPASLIPAYMAYDGLGNLAVALYPNGVGSMATFVYAPGASIPSYTIPNVGGHVSFDGKNELIVVHPTASREQTISFYAPGATAPSRTGNYPIAATTTDAAGDIAGIAQSNSIEIIHANGTITTLSNFSGPRTPAFSP